MSSNKVYPRQQYIPGASGKIFSNRVRFPYAFLAAAILETAQKDVRGMWGASTQARISAMLFLNRKNLDGGEWLDILTDLARFCYQ